MEIVTGKQTYKITNGTNGTNGTSGDAWTIGDDGFWYKNNEKTQWKAVGQNGTNGTNGTNGEYYVPNGNGFFDKVDANGNRTTTDISYVTVAENGVAVLWDGRKLTLSFKDADGNTVNKVIDALGELKSLVTVPQAYYEGAEAVIYRHMQYRPLTWVAAKGKNHLTGDVSDERQEIAAAAPLYHIYPLMKVQYYVNPENADLTGIELSRVLEKNMDEHFVVTGTALPLKEPTGETAGGIILFAVIHGEGHEVRTFFHLSGAGNGGKQHGATHFHNSGAGGLLGQFSGLDLDYPTVG